MGSGDRCSEGRRRCTYAGRARPVRGDFPGNEALAGLAARIYEQGKVAAAVCHGVTGLFDIRLSDQRYLVDGRQVTGFANIEETMMGLSSKVPFLTESRLKERGGKYQRGLPFMSHVVVSDRLVTGQNPRSTRAVARKVIELLAAQPARPGTEVQNITAVAHDAARPTA